MRFIKEKPRPSHVKERKLQGRALFIKEVGDENRLENNVSETKRTH